MAKTPDAVAELLGGGVAESGRAQRARSAMRCRSRRSAEGGNFELAAWDWRYYAEKVRKAAL